MGVRPLPWGLRPLTQVSADWCRSAPTQKCSHSCCPPSTTCCKQTSSFDCPTATKYAQNKQTLSRFMYINSQAAAQCLIYFIHTSSKDFFIKIHMKHWHSCRIRTHLNVAITYMLSLPVSPGASRYCTTSPGFPAGAANLPVFNETQTNKFYLTYPAACR